VVKLTSIGVAIARNLTRRSSSWKSSSGRRSSPSRTNCACYPDSAWCILPSCAVLESDVVWYWHCLSTNFATPTTYFELFSTLLVFLPMPSPRRLVCRYSVLYIVSKRLRFAAFALRALQSHADHPALSLRLAHELVVV
jgi:hypothetical protein